MMTKITERLTQKRVDELKVGANRTDRTVWDADQRGLGLRFQSGRHTWVVRGRVAGRQIQKTLEGNLTLAQARREAAAIRTKAKSGVDLVEEGRVAARERRRLAEAQRRAEEAERTRRLAVVAERYIAHAEAELAPGTIREVRRYLREHWKPLHEHVADGLDRRTIVGRLEEIAGASGKIAANRAKAYLSMCLAWGVQRGLLAANPVAGVRSLNDERPRERVLAAAELAAVWSATAEGGDFASIVRLLLLTGARRQEVGAMTWTELDLDRARWTVPAERTKNRRPHVVPLSNLAGALLVARQRIEDRTFVFGRGQGFSGWGRALARLHAASVTSGWSLHDLRRTTVTGMAEIGIMPHVIEAVVNHASGHKAGVAGVYNRAEYRAEKAEALQRWAEHLEALAAASAGPR